MMRRTLYLSLAALVMAALAALGVTSALAKGGETVTVKLGAVPKVMTEAKADATFTLGKDGKSLHYKVNVEKLRDGTMAHIHAIADDGSPGAILAWLYPVKGESPSLKEGEFSGTLAEGSLTADRLAGPMKGKTVKDVLGMLGHGTAGVAIHTKQNSGGELWGVAKAMGQMKMGY